MPLICVLGCPGFHIAAFGATEGLQFWQRPGEWCYRGPPVWRNAPASGVTAPPAEIAVRPTRIADWLLPSW
eukprot:9492446-Alexandrium_andersonii.AAC.1